MSAKKLRSAFLAKGSDAVLSVTFGDRIDGGKFSFQLLGRKDKTSSCSSSKPASFALSARLEFFPPENKEKTQEIAVLVRVLLREVKRNDVKEDDILLREAFFYEPGVSKSSSPTTQRGGQRRRTNSFGFEDFFESNADFDFDDERFSIVLSAEFYDIATTKKEEEQNDALQLSERRPIVACCIFVSSLMFVFENFLDSSECEEFLSLGENDLKRSRVTHGKLSSGRTSSSCFLINDRSEDAVVRSVEKRMMEDARLPIVRSRREDYKELGVKEPMQIVRYEKNEKYTCHFDNKGGSKRRVATFMVYLRANENLKEGLRTFQKRRPCSKKNTKKMFSSLV